MAPTKYSPDLPDYIRSSVEKTEHGMTYKEVGELLGKKINKTGRPIDTKTLWTWRQKYPDFDQAFDDVRLEVIKKVESSLFKSCMGYTVVDTQITENPDGSKKNVETKKEIGPNVTAIIYFLGNRARKEWQSVNRVEHSGPEGEPLTVKILRGASMDDL